MVSLADLESADGSRTRIECVAVASDKVVTGSTWGSPPAPRFMTGDEGIEGTGVTLRDFWAWSMSDLRANTVRSSLAEFLVARAVGADHRPPVEWDSYDVLTPDGVRVEVKCGAYLQTWAQSRLSTVTFGGLKARTWSAEEGYSLAESYNADVYVFAVHTATDHTSYDALDVDQWSFWVLPRDVVAETGQRSIRLSRVEARAGSSVTYAELAARVRDAALGTGRPDPWPATAVTRGE
jgi:hypothetical protein